MANRNNLHQGQAGAVLIISLIMLLLLTLIGVTGTGVSTLEEKMAGNMRDRSLAFQAAESALRSGEAAVAAALAVCPTVQPAGFYQLQDADCDGTKETTPVWDTIIWSDDNKSIKYNTDANSATIDLANLSADPRYIIEDVGASCAAVETPCQAVNQRHNFRITARATGGTTNSVVMLQSIYQINAP